MNAKVTFENENQDKIIIDFILDEETGNLEYKPTFDPPVTPETPLGLSGQLCDVFIKALHSQNIEDDETTEFIPDEPTTTDQD